MELNDQEIAQLTEQDFIIENPAKWRGAILRGALIQTVKVTGLTHQTIARLAGISPRTLANMGRGLGLTSKTSDLLLLGSLVQIAMIRNEFRKWEKDFIKASREVEL